MTRTIMVTGGTGLVGANVCGFAREAGDTVVALVRDGSDSAALEALGVTIVRGDISMAADVLRASESADAIVHCAAVLGGTYGVNDPAVHDAVNIGGMTNVLDAAADHGSRVVYISTTAFFLSDGVTPWVETTPYSPANPESESNYTRSKRAAQQQLDARAETGQDVQSVFPGAIYGPSPAAERAVEIAGQNAMILRAIRGDLPRYPAISVGWVLGEQVARRALLALDRGAPGGRYLAMGDNRDKEYSFPAFLSYACELAGVDHRVAPTPKPSEDPTVVEEFGMFAYASEVKKPEPAFDDSETQRILGDAPVPVAEGLPRTVEWFRTVGEI
ncbi:MAG: dihydroflavonol 4-reductase [Microbacteriaceae bacterium]|nr:dihydroflavonol 4-reductase [Microbacteriaceae bacterium]